MSLPWWEFIIRGLVVYLVLLILLRIGGKKQVAQLSPFDFVLLLIVSNAVQNSMNGGDNSLIGGLISALALFSLNWLFDHFSYRSKKFSDVVEGRPEIFIHNGKLNASILKKEKISDHELQSILRKNGVDDIAQVKIGVLEATGEISIIRK